MKKEPCRHALLLVYGASAFVALATACASSNGQDSNGWIAHVKRIHNRFTGKSGTVGQYGDSITYSKAFFSALYNGDYKPESGVKRFRDLADRRCFEWKGPEHCNYSGWRITDGLKVIDRVLKEENPEIAFIMFGTNDLNHGPPDQTNFGKDLDTFLRKVEANGTVPVLFTIPPRRDSNEFVEKYNKVIQGIASRRKLAIVDYYRAIVVRRPGDWDGTLISGDGVHPSYPAPYRHDFSEEGLRNSGYTLRNYLALSMYLRIRKIVETPSQVKKNGDSTFAGAMLSGASEGVLFVQ